MYDDARQEWYDSHNAYEVRDIDRVFPDFDLRFPWQAQARMYDAPQMSGNEQTFGQDFFDELYQVADDVSDIGKGAIQVGLTSLGAILFPPYQPAISAGVEVHLPNLVGETMTNTRKNIAVEVAVSEEAGVNQTYKHQQYG